MYPAEVFPTKFRATAHGMSAACGKAGAIISALAFNSLSKKIGTPAVLWSASLPLSLSLRLVPCPGVHGTDGRSVNSLLRVLYRRRRLLAAAA